MATSEKVGSSAGGAPTAFVRSVLGRGLTLGVLRWLTIVIPLAFLIAVDYLRHFLFPQLLHPFSGFLVVLAFVAVAVFLFSRTVFGAIERMEAQILDQNRKLAAVGETARRQAAQLRALHEAGLALTSDLALELVLERGVDLARELIGARYGALAVLGDDGIAYFLTSGLTAEERAQLGNPPRGRGLLGAVFAERRPVRVDSIPADTRSVGFPAHHPPMTTLLGVPVFAKGRTIGSLYLTDKVGPAGQAVPFSDEDEELLQLFAAQAAAALENARLHSKIESLAATAERERIARELHDSLAQALGFVGVRAQAARAALAAGDTTEVGQALDRMRSVAESAYADVREAILGLRSGVAADRDLTEALREYLQRYQFQSGIKTEIAIVGSADRVRLTPAGEVQLLRIIQEALSNVRKHARATIARVRLEQVELPHGGLALRAVVEDDGLGFDLAAIAGDAGRYGLSTMRERAEGAGGRFRVETTPGSGTRITIELPALGLPAEIGDGAGKEGGTR